ncbi:GNAT family N-acetyltransferase [Limosilactobacillus caecicola]|uniref:GNAT family N-acetyltransferase n=1 Tax=Limosilactobacillus caecicola TaxID=2941332 RepID=UPI00203D9FD4|nr:GNAT family N-acetyltransferase [Limosilactobacillus caecicola]
MALNTVNDPHLQLVTDDPMDLERLQKIAKQTFTETFGADNDPADLKEFLDTNYSINQLRDEINAVDSRTYFYNLNGQIAGYLKLNWDSSQTEPDYPEAMEIQRIYVLQRFQKLHIGGRLMKTALEVADELHKPAVWLGVWENNDNAQGFYHHYGFERVGEHTFVVGTDRQTDYLLMKKLA